MRMRLVRSTPRSAKRKCSVALAALLLVALTGCPRRDEHGRDRATVHVVTQHGTPAAGALVMVHDDTGRFIAMGDAPEGDVRVTVEENDSITAFYAFTTDIGLDLVSLYTIAGVQPDDELWLPVQSFDITGPDRGEITVTLSGTSAGGADSYGYALAGCPGANHSSLNPSGTGSITVPATCPGDAFEPWAVARYQGVPLAFELLPEDSLANLVANGMTFTGPWRTDFTDVSYSLTNIPDGTYNFSISHRQYDAESRRLSSDGAAAAVLGLTTTSGSMQSIPFVTADFAWSETLANGTAGTLAVTRAAPLGAIAIDYATLPDYLDGASIALGLDSRLEITLTGAPEPGTMDLLELYATYGVAQDRIAVWTFRAPPDSVIPFRFPEWPAEISGDAPPVDPSIVDLAWVRFTDGEWASWDEARVDDPRDDVSTADRRSVKRNLD